MFGLNRVLWHQTLADQVCMIVQTNVTKNTSYIKGRDIKSQMLYVSWQSFLLHYGDHYIPCFLIIPLCIGLRWFLDAVIIHLSIHISSIQSKTNGSKNTGTSCQYCLPLRHYDALACAFGLRWSFLRLLSKTTYSFACKTNRIVAGVL